MNSSREQYEEVIGKEGFGEIDFDIDIEGGDVLEEDFLENRYLAHLNGEEFAENADENSVVVTGFGISGEPHLGTVSQILNAKSFLDAGLDVKIILGDLDSYNARDMDLEDVRELVPKYKEFIQGLGFSAEGGVVKSQEEDFEAMHASFLISKYLQNEDFLAAKEDLDELNEERDIVDGIDFPVKQSMLLMMGGILGLGIEEDYDNVLVSMGVDEHRYLEVVEELGDRAEAGVDISGVFTPLIKGFNGHSKMSKSIPESSLDVTASEEEVYDKILEPGDDYEEPEDSVVYQMMSQVSDYDAEQLDELYELCEQGGVAWERAKEEYAEELASLFENWG